MFLGFNLNLDKNFFETLNRGSLYIEQGTDINAKNISHVQKSLEPYLSADGVINGKNLRNDWFPEIDAHVFISHSHADEELALKLAGWLNLNFGLVPFIDSHVWGYANDLLRDIDNAYCLNKNNTYNYQKRNYSTSHVHIMLSTALREMINKTECVIFLNTENSLIPNKEKKIETWTFSPWIFSEIVTTKLIQRSDISCERISNIKNINKEYNFSKLVFNESSQLLIKHKLELDHLIELNSDDLINWKKNSPGYDTKEVALDTLYALKYQKIFK